MGGTNHVRASSLSDMSSSVSKHTCVFVYVSLARFLRSKVEGESEDGNIVHFPNVESQRIHPGPIPVTRLFPSQFSAADKFFMPGLSSLDTSKRMLTMRSGNITPYVTPCLAPVLIKVPRKCVCTKRNHVRLVCLPR